MKNERLAIYGHDFPKGFEGISECVRVSRDKLKGLPQSFFPRAAKDGEHLVQVRVDPNGARYERGDIILAQTIKSNAFPGLRGDWEIVQAKERWTKSHDGSITGWYRYLLVKPAKPADAAAARAVADAHTKKVMDASMFS